MRMSVSTGLSGSRLSGDREAGALDRGTGSPMDYGQYGHRYQTPEPRHGLELHLWRNRQPWRCCRRVRKVCQSLTPLTAARRYDIRIERPRASKEDIILQPIACSALVRLTLLAASSMLAASRAVGQSAPLHGVAYADANANGKRDVSEPG